MPDREMRIETGKRGGDASGLFLRVVEAKSGELVLAVNLTATEAFDMMTGGSIHIIGKQSPNLGRYGKTMVNETFKPPSADIGYPMSKDEQLTASKAWAERAHPGWEAYEPRMTNAGPVVIGRKWISDEDGAV